MTDCKTALALPTDTDAQVVLLGEDGEAEDQASVISSEPTTSSS